MVKKLQEKTYTLYEDVDSENEIIVNEQKLLRVWGKLRDKYESHLLKNYWTIINELYLIKGGTVEVYGTDSRVPSYIYFTHETKKGLADLIKLFNLPSK